MKKIALSLIAAASAAFSTASAQGPELEVSTSVDYVTEYVFRGQELADAAVQPGVGLAYGDVNFGVWSSFATNNDAKSEDANASDNEFDLYGSYSVALSDLVSADFGWTLYYYPNTSNQIDGNDYTNEPFASFSFDTILSPSLMVAYDLDLENITVEGGIGYSLDLPYANTTLDLGLYLGDVEVDSGSDYIYYGLDSSVNYQMSANGSIGVGLSYASNDLDDTADNNLIGSVSVSASF